MNDMTHFVHQRKNMFNSFPSHMNHDIFKTCPKLMTINKNKGIACYTLSFCPVACDVAE